jgi:hypothetical protein
LVVRDVLEQLVNREAMEDKRSVRRERKAMLESQEMKATKEMWVRMVSVECRENVVLKDHQV